MHKVTVDEWRHIAAGETVDNGYSSGTCTAPKEPGFYTLHELVYENNTHAGWKWEKEEV